MTTNETTTSSLTVAEAVDRLCGYCAEQWKDYLYARQVEREAEHHEQRFEADLKHAEEGRYLTQRELDALSAQADRAARDLGCQARVRRSTADWVADAVRDCSRCDFLLDVLFPRHHAAAIFGYDRTDGYPIETNVGGDDA